MKKELKFYRFRQSNSGGSFVVDKKVCHEVIVEASNKEEAIEIAMDLGIYFNGVDDGFDCPCCGDRWYEPYSHIEFPIKWDENKTFVTIEEYAQFVANEYGWTKPDIRIFYKNGEVKEIFSSKRELK